VSVIALVPPTQGIRAALTASGISRVVVGGTGGTFPLVTIRRNPELVALTSPNNATGLFEMDMQSDMLLPFEAMGVDTAWELQLPKASNAFDFGSIADVVLTIDYTALNSYDYRQQVIQALDPQVSADLTFSLRQQFPDQWYELNNPDPAAPLRAVRFNTLRSDFPPNLDDLRVQQVALYFLQNGTVEVPVSYFTLSRPDGTAPAGGSATSTGGIISSRGNANASWSGMIRQSPVGQWDLALPNTSDVQQLFDGQLQDIVLALTFSGQLAAWPA